MKIRRFFNYLSAILLAFACICSPLILTSCDSDQTDQLTFKLNEDGITYSVTRYNGYGGTVTIPEYYNDMRVTEIKNGAFAGSTVKKIILPETITKIGQSAFQDCVSLKSINIPEFVTEIGHDAFSNCRNLKNVTLPQSLTSIYESSFCYCLDATIRYEGTKAELTSIMLDPRYFDAMGKITYDYEIECSDGKIYISTLYYR